MTCYRLTPVLLQTYSTYGCHILIPTDKRLLFSSNVLKNLLFSLFIFFFIIQNPCFLLTSNRQYIFKRQQGGANLSNTEYIIKGTKGCKPAYKKMIPKLRCQCITIYTPKTYTKATTAKKLFGDGSTMPEYQLHK